MRLFCQLKAVRSLSPTRQSLQLYSRAVRVPNRGLVELGLLKGEIDKLIGEKNTPLHRTGHWLGLDVHDVGVYQHGESAQILQPGQVLTVEPGLYIVSDTKLTKTNQILTLAGVALGLR